MGWLVNELGLLGFTSASATEKVSPGVDSLQVALQGREQQLNDREKELQAKERALADKEQLLIQQNAEHEKLIQNLKEKVGESEKKQKMSDATFIQIYEKMDPKKAAHILDELEVDLAVNILRSLRPSIAAEVLGNMSSKRAKISTKGKLLGRNISSSSEDKKVSQ